MNGPELKESDHNTAAAEAWVLGFGAGVVVLALMFIAFEIGYSRGQGEAPQTKTQPAAQTPAQPQPATGPGRELFAANCGSCHTLSAAETSGTVGPNLDDLQPDEAQVQAAIINGGTGSGVMPPGLLQGQQAKEVAAFVAGNAGR
jgi:mono/diheme cytochrome c family protein